MNRKSFLPLVLAVFVFASFLAGAAENPQPMKPAKTPDNVKAILEKTCIGCHNTDSKNDKAKEALDLKTYDQLDKAGMLHALKEINETLAKNEMPPAKFLEKYPDKKLSDADKKTLMDWAVSETEALKKK